MRTLKHAALSLWRKPTKAIMIFLIMFIVFGLVFTGIIIQNSIAESKEYVRIEMGGIVEYQADYMSFYADDKGDYDETDYEQLRLSTTIAEEIAKDPDVVNYYTVGQGGSESRSLKTGNKKIIEQNAEYEKERAQYETEDGMGGEYVQSYYFQITGTNNEVPIEFESEKYVLTSGRSFTKEDVETSAKVVIVSEEVQASNGLNVGDMVGFVNWNLMYMNQEESQFDEFGNYIEPEVVEEMYEVIGFYSGATEYEVDRIFMTLNTLNVMNGYVMEDFDYSISNIYFLVSDPLQVDAFIERNESKMPSEYTILTAGDSEYETLTRPLDLMAMISQILIWVIFIAGALIIISIVTIFVRDRRFEVGLLLSVGESKGKIVFQFIFEIMIVALLAFAFATGASQASSGFVANWIIETQLVEEESTNPEDFYGYYGQQSMQNEVTMENIAEDFEVGLSLEVLFNLLLISLGILVAASSIPLLVIVAYKPRKALQD